MTVFQTELQIKNRKVRQTMKTTHPAPAKPVLERLYRFTIIELLIVVSIIAILAGMLLPALSSARKKARDIACMNSLKQQGTLILSYADISDGSFPYYYQTTNPKLTWIDSLYWTLISKNSPVDTRDVSVKYAYYKEGTGSKNWGKKRIPSAPFACPSQTNRTYHPDEAQVDYGINGFISGQRKRVINNLPWKLGTPARLQQIKSPSRVAAVFDITKFKVGAYYTPDAITKSTMSTQDPANTFPAWRHGGDSGANILWSDSHVSFMRERVIPDAIDYSDIIPFWYYKKP